MWSEGAPPSRRIVVTGLGVVSPWGWGLQPFHSGIFSGQTAIRPFTRFDHSRQRSHVAGEAPPPPPELRQRLPALGRLSYADA